MAARPGTVPARAWHRIRPAVRRQRMGTERTGRTAPVRVHGRHRGAIRVSALSGRAVGQRPGLQPARRVGPERDGHHEQRPLDRSGDGPQVSINAARGDTTFVFDLRTTKFIRSGDRRLGLFVEFFNLFNTVNHGAEFQGNGRRATFRQPNGYIPGSGTRGNSMGARFLFRNRAGQAPSAAGGCGCGRPACAAASSVTNGDYHRDAT